ncbi:hypothetical protein L9F63_023754, partial [Diploptera punctata]
LRSLLRFTLCMGEFQSWRYMRPRHHTVVQVHFMFKRFIQNAVDMTQQRILYISFNKVIGITQVSEELRSNFGIRIQFFSDIQNMFEREFHS